MSHYISSAEAVLENLNSSKDGLMQEEVEKRQIENGKNELDKANKKSLLRRFFEQLINPMVLILLVAAAVSLTLTILNVTGVIQGEDITASEWAEAGIILAVVLINTVLGVFQESKAEKAIEALQKMSAGTAKVRRNGIVLQIPTSELTIGDIILVEAGDAIPADMRLIQCASLKIEEAALTGESVPVEKRVEALKSDANVSLGDRKNMAYMGSSVVYGRGEGVVTGVGMNTEMGKIAKIIQTTQEGQTPLQKNLSKLSKFLTFIVLGICAVVFAVGLVTTGKYDITGIMNSFMLAVSLAVAAIPEGLAAVVTIVLSIGVTNMAKRSAIIRKLPAVETLGCAQVICSDKTGTLTQNKMTVVESYGDTKLLAKAMALCCDSQSTPTGEIIGDPTENALVAFALKEGFDKNALNIEFPRVAEAPFDSIRKMMSTIHKTKDGIIQYTKGAPDEVLKNCSKALIGGQIVELNPKIIKDITEKNKQYADKALRVLACAYKNYSSVPVDCSPEKIENNLIFIGLEAMIDPVRPEVKAAVESCKSSGIKVVMITGDHKETAAAIAKELGIIESSAQAVTGLELDKISDEEFEKRIENIFVYARVQPEHKVRIVNMWKQKGYVTAMTGDGVNDAPAIKSGDIGIGMGITGTDVTKNVADMVLADDNFATIVSAVEEGRRIYDNIRKTIQFLLSSNLSEVITIFVATLSGFIIFNPVHLLFINLVTDSIPAVALGMEHAEDSIMERPPRKQKKNIFADGLGFGVAYQGILIAGLTLAAYFIVNAMEPNGAATNGINTYATTAAFLTMCMCEIFHAYNMRSQQQSIFKLKKHNKMLWIAMVASFALTMLIIYVPPIASIFELRSLNISEVLIALGLSITIVPLVEIIKLIQRRIDKNRGNAVNLK